MAGILTVTPNPAVDVTYSVDRQTLGETVRVRGVDRRPGGKGLNVARVLRQLGRDVAAVHPLGGDAGHWIAEALAHEGLPAVTSPIAGETRTTVTVVDGITHPTLLAEPGPALTDVEWDALTAAVQASLQPGDWVVVAGSFPPEATDAHCTGLIAGVRDRGGRVLVDTSGPLLLVAADAGADVVKANAQEVREATRDDETSRALARLGRGGSLVVLSRGSDGLLLRRPDGSIREQTGLPGMTGNPTGAGDAATAGFLAAVADGRHDEAALAWAAIAGAAAVLRPVAGEIDLDRLSDLCVRAGLPPTALRPDPESKRKSP